MRSFLFFLLFFLIASPLMADDLTLPTYLRPIRESELSSPQNGIIADIPVKRGDEVEAGQKVFSLNSAVLEAQLAQSKVQANQSGRLEAAEAELAIAEDRLKIISGLKSRGTSNDAELRKARSTVEVASGNVQAAEEELQVLKMQVDRIAAELEELTIRSPITGVVTEINREVAESVTARGGQDEGYIVKVVDLSRLWAKAHVPYLRAESLRAGQELQISLQDSGKTKAVGNITYLSPTVDAATGLTEIHVTFDNEEGKLKSGIPAEILIPVGEE